MPIVGRSPNPNRAIVAPRASEYDLQREKTIATVDDGLFIILDDSRVNEIFDYSGTAWWTPHRDDGRWVNGTEMVFGEGSTEGAGEMTVLADGVQISFVGRAPPASAGHTLKVEVNHDTTTSASLLDAPFASTSQASSSYRTWLTLSLPTRSSDEPHFVDINDIPAGTSLDYAVLQVHEGTPVLGELAIVDEMHKSVTYDGWERRTGPVVGASADGGVYYPYGGSVHEARDVGGSMDVVFVGTSISVYGMFTATNGSLSASHTIDSGSAQSRTYSSNTATLPNTLLFTQPDLSPGFHTLTLTITENTSANQTLAVDYMTYHPSFESVSNLLSSEGAGRGEGERGKPRMTKGALAGMIVGVVVAVVVLIGLVCMRQAFVRWVKGVFTIRRWGKSGKGGDAEKGVKGMNPKTDPWSSQSPHYAFNVPGRNGSPGVLNTISTLDFPSTPATTSLEIEKEVEMGMGMKDVESPPPSLHSRKGVAR